MRNRLITVFTVLVALLIVAGPLFAHHANAVFDVGKRITVTGTVTEWFWAKTITIDDPKYYTRPWVALDRLPYRLQPASLDIPEQECGPAETAKYNELFANPAAGVGDAAR